MEVKFTPWRFTYIVSPKPADCIFCEAAAQHNDVLNHVLHRGKTTFVILNRYPYNNGHLMVVPYRHIADLDALTTDEISEIAEATRHAVTVLSRTMNPSGFNIGLATITLCCAVHSRGTVGVSRAGGKARRKAAGRHAAGTGRAQPINRDDRMAGVSSLYDRPTTDSP
ncbi:MAG: HIT domain-containing protein [Chloroflexi bacterium]|nr:HIT domain-containing protein [Chloroflexota bacterium]